MENKKMISKEEMLEKFSIDIDTVTGRNFIMEHVIYELVNYEKFQKKLESVVHKKFLDLAVTYRVVIDDNKERRASYLFDKKLLERKKITENDLDRAAEQNTRRMGCRFESIMKVLGYMLKAEESWDTPEDMVYVVTNENYNNGSSIMMIDDVMDSICEKLGGRMFVIPSSRDELIVIPCGLYDGAITEIINTISQVNETLTEDEYLSDKLYVYEKGGRMQIEV